MNRITSCTLSPEMREEAVAKLALRKGIMSLTKPGREAGVE